MKLFNKSLLLLSFLILMTSCSWFKKSKKTSCYEYSGRPTQALTYKEMALMINHYDKTKMPTRINSRVQKTDTWLYHYNLKDLKAYIAYIEKLSKDKNIEVTGINIRAAAYPNSLNYGKKRDYQTLIFMPTTTIDTIERVSFDPLYSQLGVPNPIDNILKIYLDQLNPNPGEYIQVIDKPSIAANRTQQTPPE